MKYFFLISLLLAFCAGCAKTDFGYAVVCDFRPSFSHESAWLVVSNDDGDILHSFVLQAGQTSLVEEFNFKTKTGEDTYNLHWIRRPKSGSASVYSLYGVQNAASAVFQPESVYNNIVYSGVGIRLNVQALPALDSLDIPGIMVGPNSINAPFRYDSASHVLSIDYARSHDWYRYVQQGIVVRIRTTATSPFHSLYLPAATLPTDTAAISVNWSSFSPETNFLAVTLPPMSDSAWFGVEAIEGDAGQFTPLAHEKRGNISQFNVPVGVDGNTPLRLSLHHHDYVQEKIVHIGESLHLEAANMQITGARLSRSKLSIQTEGEMDKLAVFFYVSDTYLDSWHIEGEPANLKQAILPDLSEFIPDWSSKIQAKDDIYISAFQYEQLNYPQLLDGLPYKGNGLVWFPEARYGFKRLYAKF